MFILWSLAMGGERSADAAEPFKSNSNMGRDPLKLRGGEEAQFVITGVTSLASLKLFLT